MDDTRPRPDPDPPDQPAAAGPPAPAPADAGSGSLATPAAPGGDPAGNPPVVPGTSLPPPRGQVVIDFARCTLTGACAEVCPTPALRLEPDPRANRATLTLDHGACVFCGLCAEACDAGAVRLTETVRLAVTRREDLVGRGRYGKAGGGRPAAQADGTAAAVLAELPGPARVRHLDAGSCNGCEIELEALLGPGHSLARHGIELVREPAHAQILLVTGTVTPVLAAAVRAAWAAMAPPRRLVAAGACPISGGIFAGLATAGAAAALPQVDVLVPGCPPPPEALLHGLLVALGRRPPALAAVSWAGPWPR